MNSSNAYFEEKEIKVNSLIFQLKESCHLERVCALLRTALSKDHEATFYMKLESSIGVVQRRVLENEYDEMGRFGKDLEGLLKLYWSCRGKQWDQRVRAEVEKKVKDGSEFSCSVSKSKLPFSRRVGL